MITVREYVQNELDTHQNKVAELAELLYQLPVEVGELESDSVTAYGNWLILRDTSHKDLGAKLASITDQTAVFKTIGQTRTAVFRNVGPFYKVDFDRPNPNCRKVRVLKPAKPAQEEVISICGDIPPGYELLEELDLREEQDGTEVTSN